LNRFAELKEFIKYGGAEAFHNVEIEFIRGRKAVLTIYHDGEEHEQVELQSIGTKKEIHQMMLDKGFTLKSEEEIAEMQARGERQMNFEEKAKTETEKEDIRMREQILEEQRHRAESFHGSPKGDELIKLTQRIKELKKEGGSEEKVKELEKRRIKLIGEGMLTGQHQLKAEL
jgi:hypothetical protein